jgi:hypothetical protein
LRRRAKQLKPGERLIVNPTSGTKQMSAGATLAALDEEVDQIDFTSGERVDGVVKTGTEVVQSFDLRGFLVPARPSHRRRTLPPRRFLCRRPAAQRVSPSPKPCAARETALCLHEWQRMNYPKAASHAAKFSEALRAHLKAPLPRPTPSARRCSGTFLAGADELLRWGDCEEALARYYRGAEQAAKVRLAEAHSIRPPYRLESVLDILPAGCRLAEDLQRWGPRNGVILLTAQKAWDVLDACDDPMAQSYFADQKLQDGLQRRNESMYGHGQEPVEAAQVHAVCDRLRNLLNDAPARRFGLLDHGAPPPLPGLAARHDDARKLFYDSPVTGPVEIFNHDPR